MDLEYYNPSTASYSKSSVGIVDTTGNQFFNPLSSNTGIGVFPTMIIQPNWTIGEAPKQSFKFDWAEGLSNLKGEINSVELSHEALKWR
jgi:hypothetical protein